MMIIYLYFLMFLAVAVTSQFIGSRTIRRNFEIVACFILLFGFFGFRDITVLNDTPHYYGFYYKLARYRNYLEESVFAINPYDRFEYGYQVIVHFLIKYVSRDPYTIIWFSSLVLTIGNLWFISKRVDNIVIVTFAILLLGNFYTQYCLIRQSFALMFFYVAYGYLEKDKPWIYTSIILIATLFHYTAFALLALPLLKLLKIDRRNIIIIFVLTFAFAVLILQIMTMLGLTNNIYFQQMIKRDKAPLAAILDCLLLVLIYATCLFVHFKMRLKEVDKSYFWTCLFSLCVSIITIVFLPLFRVNTYLLPIAIIQLMRYLTPAYTFKEEREGTVPAPLKQKELRRFLQIVILFILFVRISVTMTFRNEWNHVTPYRFYDFSDRFHYYYLYWD